RPSGAWATAFEHERASLPAHAPDAAGRVCAARRGPAARSRPRLRARDAGNAPNRARRHLGGAGGTPPARGVVLPRWILGPLENLRRASSRFAGGDLTTRAPESGPRELGEVSASFNEMAANIEQLFDARRQLVAWGSHDLRTPLASLRAMIEALEDDLASMDEYLPAIREQLETLTLLVDDLFELARIDAGGLAPGVQENPLAAPVFSSLRGLAAGARARHVRLEARLDPGDPRVRIE